ncbi:MAG: hypothetical protein EKK53_24555 [Burkholderiales bacterium]|jgi:hypothetical protein|nr:MAG: hypothetical protein EKK53_24555 [Burkholderiales bacterium]
MIEKVQHMTVGRIMTSFILQAYSEVYTDVRFDDYVGVALRPLARDMAGRCLAGPGALFSVGEALIASRTIFASSPQKAALVPGWLKTRRTAPSRSRC